MHNVLAISILGTGVTGAILIISVALLFNPPVGIVGKMVTAASAVAFLIFTISALVFRKRLDEKRK